MIRTFRTKAANNLVESPKIDSQKEIEKGINYHILIMSQNSYLIDINHMKRKWRKYKHFLEVISTARNI